MRIQFTVPLFRLNALIPTKSSYRRSFIAMAKDDLLDLISEQMSCMDGSKPTSKHV